MTAQTGISALEQRLLGTYASKGVVSAQGPNDMHFVLPGATLAQARYNHHQGRNMNLPAAYAAAIICELAKIMVYGASLYTAISAAQSILKP